VSVPPMFASRPRSLPEPAQHDEVTHVVLWIAWILMAIKKATSGTFLASLSK
jgi:hypothetical protein